MFAKFYLISAIIFQVEGIVGVADGVPSMWANFAKEEEEESHPQSTETVANRPTV